MKMNCWEYKKCGREPGGTNAIEQGVCPSATEARVDGCNSGTNAGRACWAVTGTLCGGVVQGSYAMKLQNCAVCDFYKLVKEEEGANYVYSKNILPMLSEAG